MTIARGRSILFHSVAVPHAHFGELILGRPTAALCAYIKGIAATYATDNDSWGFEEISLLETYSRETASSEAD